MYWCESCGAVFEDAVETLVWENFDGERGVWLHSVESCLYCGSEFLNEQKDEDAEDIDAWHEP
jgi:DNA-directed RNA polymerase subunit RPC12/RpoP